MKCRIHLLAPPNTQTTKAYSLDGFTIATIKFAAMMKSLGHTVILYGSEENEAPCDELVTVVSKQEINDGLQGSEYQYAGADNRYPLWDLANKRTIEEIGKRKQPRDFICLIGGTAQKSVCDAHPDLMAVEYSIGYLGCFAPYRVYESHAWRNTVQGIQGQYDGKFYDTVIPYFFDPEEYPFRDPKDDFALYVGRLTPRKGLEIACRAAERAGVPLKVIGHGDPSLVTNGAEYLGALDDDQKKDYMSRAKCLICPTIYVEPFGSVAVEAMLCGTPVVSTDFGAFCETIDDGVTGFRCNTLAEFSQAIADSRLLYPETIRRVACQKFGMAQAAQKYQTYFDRLHTLWDKGWET
jgi:glycosyltransferase involved in cell wall biosynthesis